MSLTFFRLMPWAPSEIGQLKWQLENMNSNTQQSWNATPEKHFVTTKKRKDRHLTDDQLRFGFLYETFVSESGCCVDLIFSLMFSFLMPTWQPHHHLANRVTQLSLTFRCALISCQNLSWMLVYENSYAGDDASFGNSDEIFGDDV